ncbi:MAG: 50S ribosomal protein L29 [Parcubacteria group bacterium]
MKIKTKELRNSTVEELQKLYRDACLKMCDLNFKAASKQQKNVREIRQAKKSIARALTLIREKQANVKK